MSSRIGKGKGRAVQVRAVRSDGWTQPRREMFLDHLAATCNVTSSAAAAGMDPGGARQLRRRDAAFAALWDGALQAGYERLEAELLARAIGAGDATLDENAIEPDGDRSAAAGAALDVELAMRLLGQRNARARAGQGRRVYRDVPIEEIEAALLCKLDALEKRFGRVA